MSKEMVLESVDSSTATTEAAFWPNATGFSAFEIRADHLRLHLADSDFVEKGGVNVLSPDLNASRVPPGYANYSQDLELDHVLVTLLEQPPGGWIGELHPPDGKFTRLQGADLDLRATDQPFGTQLDAGPVNLLPSSGSGGGAIPTFEYTPDHNYMRLSGKALWVRDGPIDAKLYGPTLRIASDQGNFTYETGSRPSTRNQGTTTVRWVGIKGENAHFVAKSAQPALFALSEARLTTHGLVQAEGAQGRLNAGTGTYFALDSDALLVGRFDIHATASQDSPLLSSDLHGELDSTTLAFARTPAAPLPGPDLVLPAALVVLGVLVALVVARIRVASKGRHSVDQVVELAYLAADAGRFAEALEWIRTARKEAPSSERLKMDEAWFLAETGEVDMALAIYMALAEGSPSGEADFHAAVLQLQHGQGLSVARPHLLRAIQRTPSVVLEMEDDPIFAQVRQDPELSRAMRLAMRKLDRARDPTA